MKSKLNIALITSASLTLASCVTIFGSKHQDLAISTSNTKSTVTVNDEKVGTGSDVNTTITRDLNAKQIKVETPDCKTTYYALLPDRVNHLYCVSCLFLYYPGAVDYINPKAHLYPNVLEATAGRKKQVKGSTDKYIDIDDVKFDIKDKDFKVVPLAYKNYKEKIDEDTDKKKGTYTSSKDVKVDNTIFSNQLSKILKKYGYIDTVNQIFKDQANSLELKASIKTLTFYSIYYMGGVAVNGTTPTASFNVCKSDITWDVLNSYGEVLKSVSVRSQSGEFVSIEKIDEMVGDMLENSLDQVLSNKDVAAFTKIDAKAETKLALTSLNKPTSIVTNASDVQPATVIVKTEKGHGSGFAITNDGYIITNYHVIASEDATKTREVTIILSDGTKVKATFVKANKDRDIALLKIDTKFDKCFAIPTSKEFQPLEEVFAMGAPKSVELGQSASKGIISSERNVNNVSLIQTNISINGGNSGGPMFNKDGKLYGIVTAKLFGLGVEGIAFAIPAYKIKDYLNIEFK
ncbi:MAG: trypsin-like peptidase domain-containing protein [Bacteroidetes bacterium]|nr:trypsin-like peptidase domain-containing protein [Bacteroidota bacterium]